jgi:hypothetical protein
MHMKLQSVSLGALELGLFAEEWRCGDNFLCGLVHVITAVAWDPVRICGSPV